MTTTLTRLVPFDSAHRVMNQNSKCRNLHGHRYVLEATFSYDEMLDIGYPIDFSDIKRVLGGFIDEYLDHGIILNPADTELIETCEKLNSKIWLIGMKYPDHPDEAGLYVNPTAENILADIDRIAYALFKDHKLVQPYKFKLYETPNAWVERPATLFSLNDKDAYHSGMFEYLAEQFLNKIGGFKNYDDRL